MSAKSPTVVYTVTLTAAQRAAAVWALQDRKLTLKKLARIIPSDRHDDLRQANAEALHIIGEAPEVELCPVSGEPLEDEPYIASESFVGRPTGAS